jgi:4-alpha-glucanotransferase
MPLQDVLMLGAESRINEPSTVGKNWTFRFKSEDISDATAKKLANLAKKYNR